MLDLMLMLESSGSNSSLLIFLGNICITIKIAFGIRALCRFLILYIGVKETGCLI